MNFREKQKIFKEIQEYGGGLGGSNDKILEILQNYKRH